MDLVLPHAMLNWATTVRVAGGSRLLDANPLSGVRREKEENPLRPIVLGERFRRTRLAMQELLLQSGQLPETRELTMLRPARRFPDLAGRATGLR
jgi:hypothetical protein